MTGAGGSWRLRVLAVMAKEFTQLTRDRLTWAMILVRPVVQLLLFGYAINAEPRNLPTAVLVQDDSVFARSFLAAVDNSDFFEITVQARTPDELDQLIAQAEEQVRPCAPMSPASSRRKTTSSRHRPAHGLPTGSRN